MRFDITLMYLLGLVTLFDHDVGLLEARVHIAVAVSRHKGNVGRLARLVLRFHPWLDDRRIRFHRFVDVGHVRQYLVVDLDEFQRLARRFGVARRHRGDGVPVVKCLVTRHAVFEDVVELAVTVGEVRQVRARDDGFDTLKLLGSFRINAANLCVSMRRAQDHAHQLPRCKRISAEARTSGHLVNSIRTRYPRTDEFEFLICELAVVFHLKTPVLFACSALAYLVALRPACAFCCRRMSPAAALTARTILS